MDKKKLVERLEKTYPDAKAELDFTSEYELLIATILSAQCTDIRVNMITKDLFPVANTPEKMIELSTEELENIIRTCGMYRQKAKNILLASQKIVDEYAGRVPETMEDLLTLAGVGRKTANVVLSNAFGVPAIAVDTHVRRLSQRLGLTEQQDPDLVERDLKEQFPPQVWSRLHHLLIFHGRRCCKARKPECYRCSIEDLCPKIGVIS